MKSCRWKSVQPTSLQHAMELCKAYALEKHNLSEQRIAERMGEENQWTLYKWISTGRIPAVKIPAYEAACGCNFVTRYLGGVAGKLMIDMPSGRNCTAQDLQELQAVLNDTTGALISFYAGNLDTLATMGALQRGLEALAWQRQNIGQYNQPQLELGEQP